MPPPANLHPTHLNPTDLAPSPPGNAATDFSELVDGVSLNLKRPVWRLI